MRGILWQVTAGERKKGKEAPSLSNVEQNGGYGNEKKMSFPSGHLGGQFIHFFLCSLRIGLFEESKRRDWRTISAVPVFLPGWPTCGAQLQAKRS